MLTPIVLTTDFGQTDGYVGMMKGAILGINPSASIVDLTHGIPTHDVTHGAFVLGSSYRYFPQGSIHVAVVDPGVGGDRRGLVVVTPRALFVGPDNGLFSWIYRDHGIVAPAPGLCRVHGVVSVIELTNSRYWLPTVSSTFHGRDIFAPVAAHLSNGVSPAELGRPAHEVHCFSLPLPTWRQDQVVGMVIHVDHFGNLVTNLRPDDLQAFPRARTALTIRGKSVRGLSRYYAEKDGLLALLGSSGLIEIAQCGGSASKAIGAGVGEEVLVSALSP